MHPFLGLWTLHATTVRLLPDAARSTNSSLFEPCILKSSRTFERIVISIMVGVRTLVFLSWRPFL